MYPRVAASLGLAFLGSLFGLEAQAQSDRPNFVFIITDDQDFHMGTLPHMTAVTEKLINEGTLFEKHFCTISICCPSRVDLWTGQMAHNTNVTNVQPPWGGYPKFIQNGYNDHHLGLWMQDSGYNTYYAGKLFNGHTIDNYNSPYMSGYTRSDFFLEPYTYEYYNVTTTWTEGEPKNFKGNYSTDIIAEDAQKFIDHATAEPDKPFFMALAPVAPHGFQSENPPANGPPQPAARHRDLFKDYKIPRTENFNPDKASSVNWIADLPKLNSTILEYNDEYQRLRLRSLMAVDELVGEVVQRLEDEGLLDNTYVFYTSDNGFHISQHRLHPGKMCGLETDISVPLVVRGPGVAKGAKRSDPSSHTDVAPTIMKLAGNRIDDKKFDGAPIDVGPIKDGDDDVKYRSEHIAVEFWGIGLAESRYGKPEGGSREYANNTYKGVRLVSEDYGFYYSVWCNNAKELYDMHNDPGQLTNLLADENLTLNFTLFNRDLDQVTHRIDALMMVLKSCKEDTCVDPWGALHPGGAVSSLKDALSEKYDSFYEDQVKVAYDECRRGYFPEIEGPQDYNVFGESGAEMRKRSFFIRPDWSEWI